MKCLDLARVSILPVSKILLLGFETVLTVLYILFVHFITGTGWFTTDPWEITEKFGGQWKTSDFKAGDVLIFTMGYCTTFKFALPILLIPKYFFIKMYFCN